MGFLLKCMLTILFYVLAGLCYFYCRGKFKVKQENQKKYNEWVTKYGKRASKATLNIVVIFTILLILQFLT